LNKAVFSKFNDPYMQKPAGQGVFLAGVLLGYMAERQAGPDGDISKSPLFKQIQFGRMDKTNLKRILSRVPQLLAAYREEMKYTAYMTRLGAAALELMLEGDAEEMGVNGNFAFAAGFINARRYFWELFLGKSEDKAGESGEEESNNGI
jgi:CRISPR-associated protein Cas8b/Csh1 subtype I-B